MLEIYAMAGLLIKHFIVDGPLQVRYQYANKGNYKHPGGYVHAGLHGLGTLIVISHFFPMIAPPLIILGVSLLDMTLHYIIDWLKVNIVDKYGWSKMNVAEKRLEVYSNNYFHALMADQLLHGLTYVLILWIIVL